MITNITRRLFIGAAALTATSLLTSLPAYADTKLKWAHVYETSHPYHQAAEWAADEISKQTDGRVSLTVHPSSSLGKEVDINEGMNIGSVDIIYTGAAFGGQYYGPIAMSNYPYMIRDYDHWKKYRDSDLFKEMQAGYLDATGHEVTALSFYGQRHVTSNKSIVKPSDMKDLKIRVPNAPLFMIFPRATGANPTPMAFSEVYLGLQQGVVDAQENPLSTIKAKKFHEVQSHISLTGHITISSLTIVSSLVKSKVSDADYQAIKEITKQASYRASDQINQSEQELGEWFKSQGIVVEKVDGEAFQDMVLNYMEDLDTPFTAEQVERLKSL
ncbi:sialic acid TRAP transporter substrate-binding protein SiaP [Marinomonas epiphytica]